MFRWRVTFSRKYFKFLKFSNYDSRSKKCTLIGLRRVKKGEFWFIRTCIVSFFVSFWDFPPFTPSDPLNSDFLTVPSLKRPKLRGVLDLSRSIFGDSPLMVLYIFFLEVPLRTKRIGFSVLVLSVFIFYKKCCGRDKVCLWIPFSCRMRNTKIAPTHLWTKRWIGETGVLVYT